MHSSCSFGQNVKILENESRHTFFSHKCPSALFCSLFPFDGSELCFCSSQKQQSRSTKTSFLLQQAQDFFHILFKLFSPIHLNVTQQPQKCTFLWLLFLTFVQGTMLLVPIQFLLGVCMLFHSVWSFFLQIFQVPITAKKHVSNAIW